MFQLKEKRVVVTGTASGIGLAIAEIFAAHEAAVVVLDLDSDKVSEATTAVCEMTGTSTEQSERCSYSAVHEGVSTDLKHSSGGQDSSISEGIVPIQVALKGRASGDYNEGKQAERW